MEQTCEIRNIRSIHYLQKVQRTHIHHIHKTWQESVELFSSDSQEKVMFGCRRPFVRKDTQLKEVNLFKSPLRGETGPMGAITMLERLSWLQARPHLAVGVHEFR